VYLPHYQAVSLAIGQHEAEYLNAMVGFCSKDKKAKLPIVGTVIANERVTRVDRGEFEPACCPRHRQADASGSIMLVFRMACADRIHSL
jgi:hypothetical protein